jgi:dTMP kinase
MSALGKLIAIEGIDGSGKHTQVRLLEHELATRGFCVLTIGFPQYDSWFGRMVGKFLNGELGPLESVDPRFSALLYAGDRFEAKAKIEAALAEGKIVLADRYIGSNLAHQTARMPPAKRSAFRKWIEHLEYSLYGMPRESLVLYLRVPPREAQTLIAGKPARSYTGAKQDLQEASLVHLEDAADMFDLLSREPPWATVQCWDAKRGSMRLPEEIAAEVFAAVAPLLATRASTTTRTGGD